MLKPKFKVGDIVKLKYYENYQGILKNTEYEIKEVKLCRIGGDPVFCYYFQNGAAFEFRLELVNKVNEMKLNVNDEVVFLNRNEGGYGGQVPPFVFGKIFTIKIVDKIYKHYNVTCDGLNYVVSPQNVAKVKRDVIGRYRFSNGRFVPRDPKFYPLEQPAVKKEKAKPIVIKEDKDALLKEKIEKLRVSLREKVGNNPGTCSYALLLENGEERFHVKDVCHARLNTYGMKIDAVVLDVKGHYEQMDSQIKKNNYKEFVNWMLNKSPWSKHFLTKDIEEAFNKGILMNVDSTGPQLGCSVIALRTYSEHGYYNWKSYVDFGLDGLQSWMACCLEHMNGNRFQDHWHHVFDGTVTVEAVKIFAKEGPHSCNGAPYKNTGSYVSPKRSFSEHQALGIKLDNFVANYPKPPKEYEGEGWDRKVKPVSKLHIANIIKDMFK